MVAASTLGFSWLVLLLAGGAGALTNLGAPLPLDPVLSAVAPEDCLYYAASSGMGPADPASSNETEKLLAEPQVQRLFAEVETQVMALVRRAGGPNREQRVLAAEAPKLVKALLTRPVALYVEELAPGPENSAIVEAALILSAGDSRDEIAGAIKELMALASEKGLPTTAESIAGVDWQRLSTPPQAPQVRFGWKDSYFIIALGEKTPANVVERMTGSGGAPAWLTNIRSEHPSDRGVASIFRESRVAYLNIAGILERAKPIVEHHHPGVWPIVERLGLTGVTAVHGIAGFDATGILRCAHVVTNGERPGLLAFLPHEPLTAADLAIAPKDALITGAVRLNAAELLQKGVELASQFHPQAKEDFEKHLWELETHLGINVRDDVVGALGEAWVAYLPGGDLMSSWLNAAAAVRVKDAVKLRSAAGKLMELAKSEMARQGDRVAIGESTVDGKTVYSVQFKGKPIPLSPSWCITDEWVVFGLLPQAVQSALDREEAYSLAATPEVKELLAGDGAPAALMYQDSAQLVRSAYPFVQMAVQMVSAPLREQGIAIDATALPSADTIVKHMRPSISTMSHREDGFHFTARGTAGGGNAVGAAPVLAALLLPAVQSARQAARDAQEMNHLKQLALAFHNYVAAHDALPTDIYSAEGKPLLSWRVQLLPYMEESSLYDRFKRDEPWDSPNNRPLLDQMPLVFASPSSGDLSNRTRYVALKGPATLFPGNEKLSFASVTDGTSNTVLFVQSSANAAVEWSRPADIEYDAANPFAGLAQPSGQFLAAMGDGSVRRLSLGLNQETMKALATRAGQEVIEYDALDAPPAPWLYNSTETPANAAGPVR